MQYIFTPANRLPEGVGFKLYGAAHLIWLAIVVAEIIVMVRIYQKLGMVGRRRYVKGIALYLLATEVIRDGLIIALGGWEWSYLPLHPCSFTMFIIAAWAFKPNRFCGNLLYGFGIVGAACALLFCNWTAQPPIQFQTIHSFVFHGILVAFILMTVMCGDIRPDGRGILHNIVFLVPVAAFASIFNFSLPDCNFFFTNGGSEGSPLEIFVKLFGEPWWLLAYVALAGVVLTLEFLPWILTDKKKAEQRVLQEAVK